MTRDQWLEKVIEAARPIFAEKGAEIPANVRAAMCPPHRRMKAVGLCWHSSTVEDEGREIWVSSQYDDPMRVAGVLIHELCHAALPDGTAHKAPFKKLAYSMGLTGKPTATSEGPDFIAIWTPILEAIGPMPGARFNGSLLSGGRKPQETPKMKNVTCPDCGFFARIRCDQVEMGRLTCPLDDGQVLMMKEEME